MFLFFIYISRCYRTRVVVNDGRNKIISASPNRREQNPEYSSWLTKYKNSDNALCKACGTTFLSRIATIKSHAGLEKHRQKLIHYSGQSKIDKLLIKSKQRANISGSKKNRVYILCSGGRT